MTFNISLSFYVDRELCISICGSGTSLSWPCWAQQMSHNFSSSMWCWLQISHCLTFTAFNPPYIFTADENASQTFSPSKFRFCGIYKFKPLKNRCFNFIPQLTEDKRILALVSEAICLDLVVWIFFDWQRLIRRVIEGFSFVFVIVHCFSWFYIFTFS